MQDLGKKYKIIHIYARSPQETNFPCTKVSLVFSMEDNANHRVLFLQLTKSFKLTYNQEICSTNHVIEYSEVLNG